MHRNNLVIVLSWDLFLHLRRVVIALELSLLLSPVLVKVGMHIHLIIELNIHVLLETYRVELLLLLASKVLFLLLLLVNASELHSYFLQFLDLKL